MIRECGIVFSRNERRLLEEMYPVLHVQFDKNDADEEALFRTWNSLNDAGTPIPSKRLRGARTIAKALEGAVMEQATVEYWEDKAVEEGHSREELGDANNPRSGAHMCFVLAEAREAQLTTVRRCVRLLDLALTECASQDLGDLVGSSI